MTQHRAETLSDCCDAHSTSASGHERPICDARAMSACPPIATKSLHRGKPTRPRRIAANIAKPPELLLRRAALEALRRRQACYIVRDANALAFAYVYYEDDRRMPWRHQMTEPITDEKFYNEHAALLGHVALAWNDCHSVVLSIFHTLSGVSWPNASSIFLALKSDHDRRETTLALMDQVLNTANDGPIRDQGAQLLGQLGNLGYEGTVATHTMWVTVIRQRKVDASKNLAKS